MKESKVKQYFIDVLPETIISDYNSVCNKLFRLTSVASSTNMSPSMMSQVRRLEERKKGLEGHLEQENIEYTKR
jgi:hypothetical protein